MLVDRASESAALPISLRVRRGWLTMSCAQQRTTGCLLLCGLPVVEAAANGRRQGATIPRCCCCVEITK
jgi:hypothetical protein